MKQINQQKALALYNEIERNNLFKSPVDQEDRSTMNIPFVFNETHISDQDFLEFCENRGLQSLKGHRSVGGFRASIYNAMSVSGVSALIAAMQEFEQQNS